VKICEIRGLFNQSLIGMKNLILFRLLVMGLLLSTTDSFSQKRVAWKKMHVLVYTKNGKGYVHDNLPNAVACIQKLGKQYGFQVTVSDTASVFTRETLEKFNCLIFASTNNNVFENDTQRLVFRHYMESGGGFVGIHSILGTERHWTWFKQLIGGTFAWHPHFQKYSVQVLDKTHPSVQGLPMTWERSDECYFNKELYPSTQVFLAHHLPTLQPKDDKEAQLIKQHKGSFGDYYPAAWHHFYDGGLAWITALGHDKGDYEDPIFVQHLFQGIEYVVRRTLKRDWKQAYAPHRDSPLKE
jgi:type 1 glutamine amidotransferase